MTATPAVGAAPKTTPIDSLSLLVREGETWRTIDPALTPLWKLAIALLQPVVEGRAIFVDADGSPVALERITCDAEQILRGFEYQTAEDAGGLIPRAWVSFVVAKES